MLQKLKTYSSFANLHIAGLCLLAIGLPLSRWLTGMAIFWLAGTFLVERNYLQKIKNFIANKPALYTCGILLIHIVWLFNTHNVDYALNDLRIKAPLFAIPFIIGSSNYITTSNTKLILQTFVLATLTSTFISFYKYITNNYADIRDISIFISHIRLALFICFSICVCLYYSTKDIVSNKKERIIYITGIVWFILFLFILKSITGLVVLVALYAFFLLTKLFGAGKKNNKRIALLLLIAIPTAGFIYVNSIHKEFTNLPIVNVAKLEKYTSKGNIYEHQVIANEIENGNYVGLYVSWTEMRTSWDKRSTLQFNSLDKKGCPVKFTLLRYLTSKGLRKDADAVYSLTNEDINAIEKGIPNYTYLNKWSLRPRIHQIFWELYNAENGNVSNGHSVAMRLLYWKNAWSVFEKNWLLGTGTGDVEEEEQYQYAKSKSTLDPQWRLRAHNQYLTFLVSFGIIGFILFIFCYLSPLITNKNLHPLYFAFLLIFSLSMLNEDTLETQAGVCFFALFVSVLGIGRTKESKHKLR